MILIGIAFSVPFLADIPGLSKPGRVGWMLIAAPTFAPLVIGQSVKPPVLKLPP